MIRVTAVVDEDLFADLNAKLLLINKNNKFNLKLTKSKLISNLLYDFVYNE